MGACMKRVQIHSLENLTGNHSLFALPQAACILLDKSFKPSGCQCSEMNDKLKEL